MAILSSGIGIDVSDHHIRIAYVNHSGIPVGLYELALSPGYVVDDKIEKPKALKKQIQKLLVKSGLQEISADTTILIPESRVFTTSFIVPKRKMSKEDRQAEIIKMGQGDIPIPFKDAFITIRAGAKMSEGTRETVLAVQKDVVSPLQAVFSSAQFPIVAIEANNKALNRLYSSFTMPDFELKTESEMLMIADIGHRWTNVTVYDHLGAVIFSRSIALKKLSEKSQGKQHIITKKALIKVCASIKDAHAYFADAGYAIPNVLIAGVEGGQKNVAELCDKAVKESKITRIGAAIQMPNVNEKDLHTYGAAIGAALRSVKQRKYRKDHNFV